MLKRVCILLILLWSSACYSLTNLNIQLTYTDHNGDAVPLPYAKLTISVVEEGPISNRYLDVPYYADKNGLINENFNYTSVNNFPMTINLFNESRPGGGMSGMWYLNGSDSDDASIYGYTTEKAIPPYSITNITINVSNLASGSSDLEKYKRKALSVWANAMNAYQFAIDNDFAPSYVPLFFPSDIILNENICNKGANEYKITLNLVCINEETYSNTQIIAEEFAHAFMRQLYGGNLPSTIGPINHGVCLQNQSEGFAWIEGFGSFYALAASGSTDGVLYTNEDMEYYGCNLQVLYTDEGRVTAALWDLYDKDNDDNKIIPTPSNPRPIDKYYGRNGLSDNNEDYIISVSTILKAMNSNLQANFEDFFNDLSPLLDENQKNKAIEIMNFNWATPELTE